MSSLTDPVPVVLCGRGIEIGRQVAEFLLPDYEVIHFLQSFEAAQSEVAHVLAGRNPQSSNTNEIGTQNYSTPARAVILGRAFEPAQAEEIRKTCASSTKEPIAWIVGDPTKKPKGAMPVLHDYTKADKRAYAETVANEIKSVLAKWRNEGAVNDGIIMY